MIFAATEKWMKRMQNNESCMNEKPCEHCEKNFEARGWCQCNEYSAWFRNSWSKVCGIFKKLEKPKDEEGYMIIR